MSPAFFRGGDNFVIHFEMNKSAGHSFEDSISEMSSGLEKQGLGLDDAPGFAKKFF